MHALRANLMIGFVLGLVLVAATGTFAGWSYLPARLLPQGERSSLGPVAESLYPSLASPSGTGAPAQIEPAAIFLPLIFGAGAASVAPDTHTLVLAPFFKRDGSASQTSAARAGQGGPYASWYSGLSVQNISTQSAANVTVTFYDADGTMRSTFDDIIDLDSSTFYTEESVNGPQGFIGSVVVSSNQPIAAIGTFQRQGSAGAGTYSGTSGGVSIFYLPTVKRNYMGFDTTIAVSAQQPTSSQVLYHTSSGPCQDSMNLNAYQTQSWQLGQTNLSCLTDGIFGAQVSADSSSIVATAIQYTDNRLAAYEGFPESKAGPVLVAPLVKANAAFNSVITIQNTDGQTADVTAEFTPSGAGSPFTLNFTLPAGGNRMLDMGQETTDNANRGAGEEWIGSAIVYSDGGAWKESSDVSAGFPSLLGNVNLTHAQGDSAAYTLFNRNQTTGYVALPYLPFGRDDFVSDIYVMNVSKQPQQVTCTAQGNNVSATLENLSPNLVATFSFRPNSVASSLEPNEVGPRTVDEEDHGDCEGCKDCDPEEERSEAGAAAIKRGRLAVVVLGMSTSDDSFFIYSGQNLAR